MSEASAADQLEHLIRHQSAQELVPFLLGLEKKDVVAVREKLKGLKKELDSLVQLKKTPGASKAPANSWSVCS